ncbi:MAG: hypothetical protein IVW55_16020 [Chloroflexi bacterium]|nr:hypothetical protein [Chloroflexota bacterium]
MADERLLESALHGARLLYAYTIYIAAPAGEVFRYTGDPGYWSKDFDGEPLPNLALRWEGKPYTAGSIMVLVPLRKDGTSTTVGAVRMELLYYRENEELSFRFLTDNHLIYRFFYEQSAPERTAFTVNVFVDGQSSPGNTLRQRLYAKKRRKASINDHMRVKGALEERVGHE